MKFSVQGQFFDAVLIYNQSDFHLSLIEGEGT